MQVRRLTLAAVVTLAAGAASGPSVARADPPPAPGRMIGLLHAWSADDSTPYTKAINNANVIVGQSGSKAVKWVDGLPLYLTEVPGYAASAATDINEAGVIVGWAGPKSGYLKRKPVRWDPDGSYTLLTGNNESSWAEAISNDGHIAGRMATSNTAARPVRIRGGRNLPIGEGSGTVAGVAAGGIVAGSFNECGTCATTAFVDGSRVGGGTGLFGLPGGSDSRTVAGAMSADGLKIFGVANDELVAWAYEANPADGVHWRRTRIGRPPLPGVLTVSAVSSDGARVGGHTRTASLEQKAWIFENGAFVVLPAYSTWVEGVNIHGTVTGAMVSAPVFWK
ncbi:hypothetical protein ACFQFC_11085 [Amorphoplanes digitatis]|uniref:Putative membrane protein n=1 Tax=Actinoplanes digitatis TaxID=1868 RepID=A0A7W7I1J9_9ACTN|nr:hypothetical protein [Actinoplanes digitatis]MBB4764742.1 putative membrane protein [Actinoplanes digitatis]GID91305.1 hypothetical protein Adi01nite_07170 [Actinoplanes digitatis]